VGETPRRHSTANPTAADPTPAVGCVSESSQSPQENRPSSPTLNTYKPHRPRSRTKCHQLPTTTVQACDVPLQRVAESVLPSQVATLGSPGRSSWGFRIPTSRPGDFHKEWKGCANPHRRRRKGRELSSPSDGGKALDNLTSFKYPPLFASNLGIWVQWLNMPMRGTLGLGAGHRLPPTATPNSQVMAFPPAASNDHPSLRRSASTCVTDRLLLSASG
jgi:hypothetical protein